MIDFVSQLKKYVLEDGKDLSLLLPSDKPYWPPRKRTNFVARMHNMPPQQLDMLLQKAETDSRSLSSGERAFIQAYKMQEIQERELDAAFEKDPFDDQKPFLDYFQLIQMVTILRFTRTNPEKKFWQSLLHCVNNYKRGKMSQIIPYQISLHLKNRKLRITLAVFV